MSKTMENFGKRIEMLRLKTFLSRRAFAIKYDISPGTLQSWEQGRYHTISTTALEKLIDAFRNENIDVDAQWILQGKSVEPDKKISSKLNKLILNENQNLEEIISLTKQNYQIHQLNEALYKAVIENNYIEVDKLIRQGATAHTNQNLNGRELLLYNSQQNTPLHLAAINGAIRIINLLAAKGASMNARNRFGQTPLHLAVYHSKNDVIDLLLQHGTVIDAVDNEGGTPVSWATYLGFLEITELLIKKGANLFYSDIQGNTPLHWACYRGHNDVIKYLLNHNVNAKAQNSKQQTPIDIAILNGHATTVELLFEYI